jgi:hypothetical protein
MIFRQAQSSYSDGSATVMVLISIAAISIVGAALVLMQKNFLSAALRVEEQSVTYDLADVCLKNASKYLQAQANISALPAVTNETSLSSTFIPVSSEISNLISSRSIKEVYRTSVINGSTNCTYKYLVGQDRMSQGSISGGEITTARDYNPNQKIEKFFTITAKPIAGGAATETVFYVGIQ